MSLDDRLLIDHLLTPFFFVDNCKEIFVLLGYYIQCFGNIFACLCLVKFFSDVVVIVLHGLANRNVPFSTFVFVRTMLGATFHLFVLSRQFSMYETDENKNNGNLRMQNVTGNETIGAPKYEENPTSLYPQEHIVNNPFPISSNTPESQGKDPNVFHSSGNAPLNSLVRTHRIAPSTSSTFWKTSINGNEPNTSNNGNVPNSNGNAALPQL